MLRVDVLSVAESFDEYEPTVDQGFRVEAKGLEPSNLLTASQALYQLSYAPETTRYVISPLGGLVGSAPP